MTGRRISQISGILAIAAASVAVAAFLASSRPDPNGRPSSTAEVEDRVMSPFCPGVLLRDCPTQEAIELRARIKGVVQKGWTNSQIDEWLVDSYGERVLASPRALETWLVPSAWLLVGIALVSTLAAKWSKRKPADPESRLEPDGAEVLAQDRARIEAELRAFAEESTE